MLQRADAHLELANLSIIGGKKSAGQHHASEARRLAYCDGPPAHTYKIAYDEADYSLNRLATRG